MLATMCLCVLDTRRAFKLAASSWIGYAGLSAPGVIAIVKLRPLTAGMVALEQITLFLLLCGSCWMRWKSTRSRIIDYERESQLRQGLIKERVKRCEAEFAADKVARQTTNAVSDSSTYMWPLGVESKSLQVAPKSAARAPAVTSGAWQMPAQDVLCKDGDCLPASAQVFVEGQQKKKAVDVQAGQRLLCWDHLSSELKYVELAEASVQAGSCEWSQLTMIDGTELTVTADHPLRVKGDDDNAVFTLGGGQIRQASALRPGRDTLTVLRVQTVQVKNVRTFRQSSPRVTLNMHQSLRFSILTSQGAETGLQAVAIESSNALLGQDCQVTASRTFIHVEPESRPSRRAASSPPSLAGRSSKDFEQSSASALRTSSEEEEPEEMLDALAMKELHLCARCKPCFFQHRHHLQPDRYPPCSKPNCRHQLCHEHHAEEYVREDKKRRNYEQRAARTRRKAYAVPMADDSIC